jgi:hypothetical protein
MRIVVTDTRRAVYEALLTTLGSLTIPVHQKVVIEIHNKPVDFFDLPSDSPHKPVTCFVNGGNCLGVMSGKLDASLSQLVPGSDMDVVKVVQRWGSTSRDGRKFLPLFSALMSPCPTQPHKWLCTAPCMFTPGPGDLRDTRNAFHSTHMALSMIRESVRMGVHFDTVVMTGMCTGRGRTNRVTSAHQMMEAFRAVFIDNNLVVDPSMSKHPRLMLNPLYTPQPLTPQNEPFQTLKQYRTAGGTLEHKLPPPHNSRMFRSGGSQEKSQFANLK